MSGFFRKLLGFILLVATVGLVTCQSMVKAESLDTLVVYHSPFISGIK
jgi:hypothetical protein